MTEASPDGTAIPQQAGPYRLSHVLGRGGMGEVYAGYDERLDRPVALKRIRPGTREPEKALQRFRREARAVAKLHHPSIVQVHDWVETDDGHWIVMELVDGCSLRRHLQQEGVPSCHQAALWGKDILEGLVAAHALGILHRDLKAENVMLAKDAATEAVRVKILDFGLAASLDTDAMDDPSSGGTLGTVSAVSPEQILDKRADQRSDLFSLGNLLYELVTGNFAFLGPNTRETLVRVCTHRQPPAHAVHPVVPEGLSLFIDRLLEKDPRRRPSDAKQALAELESVLETWPGASEKPAHVAPPPMDSSMDDTPTLSSDPLFDTLEMGRGTARSRPWLARLLSHPSKMPLLGVLAVSLLASAAVLFKPSSDPVPIHATAPPATSQPLHYVAVPGTETHGPTQSDSESMALAASAVHNGLLRGLSGLRGVAAMEPPTSAAQIEDPRELARAMAADEVLASRLECLPESCRLTLRRLGGEDGRVIWTRDFQVVPDRYLDISRAAMEHLRIAYRRFPSDPETANFGVRSEDYERYLRLRQEAGSREISVDALLQELETLESSSPLFLGTPLFRAGVLARRFQEERRSADLDSANEAITKALELAPQDPRVLIRKAQIARIGGDLEGAEETLDTLQRLEPGNALHLHQQALFFHKIGDNERARKLMQEVLQRQPSAAGWFDLSDMAYRQGDQEAARQALEEALRLEPSNYNGMSRLAQLELFGGSPQRAAEIYEQLVARAPEATELTNLGTAYLLMADYPKAAASFRRALEGSPDSPYAMLNLADAEFLSGRTREAQNLYQDVVVRVEADPDPESLQSVLAQALAHLSRTTEARRAVERALEQRPDHPWMAYEAAVVYALLGHPETAMVHMQRSLDGGVEARWFSFPWFADLPLESPNQG